jgi:hypothetical protein
VCIVIAAACEAASSIARDSTLLSFLLTPSWVDTDADARSVPLEALKSSAAAFIPSRRAASVRPTRSPSRITHRRDRAFGSAPQAVQHILSVRLHRTVEPRLGGFADAGKNPEGPAARMRFGWIGPM